MKTIHVNASRQYDVCIRRGSLARCGGDIRAVNGGTAAALVTDRTVDGLYRQTVEQSLQAAGYRTVKFVIEPGEQSKNGENFLKLLNFLAENQLTRSDLVVALGGGVVGDLAGFAAASYLRGVALVQLPTTLLAMVDSSVGGKTAIDLPAGKNLAGAFYQPSLVLCDPDALDSLPEETFSDGCAEVIKYGMIADGDLLTALKTPLRRQAEAVIARCVEIKRDVVAQDEFDTGMRQLLNFGHTIGHGVELCSGYTISHGKAVAMGMAAVTVAAERSELCPDGLYWELHDLLVQYGLPTQLPYGAQKLLQAAYSDKKRSGDEIHLVVPALRGRCVIRNLTMEEFAVLLQLCDR